MALRLLVNIRGEHPYSATMTLSEGYILESLLYVLVKKVCVLMCVTFSHGLERVTYVP